MKARVALALAILALTSPPICAGGVIESYAFVRADATLEVAGKVVRLHGIHVPETTRTCRTTLRPVVLARPTPTPTPTSPVCARACPRLHPNAWFPSSAQQPQNLNGKNYPQRNLSWDFPQIHNKRVTDLQFGWRGSPGRCSTHAGLFGLQIGAPSTSPQHFSPLPLQSPNRAIGAMPIRSLPHQAKPRRRFP